MTGIQDLYGEEEGEIEDDDGFRYDGNHASYEARSPQDISSQRNKTLMKNNTKRQALQQQSMGQMLKPANQLFELLEMEISRHKSHTMQNYLSMIERKNAGYGGYQGGYSGGMQGVDMIKPGRNAVREINKI